MVIHGLVAVLLHQFVALGGLQVLAHHFGDQFVERDLGRPAEFFFGLAGVAQQGFDFGGAEVAGVDCDDALACRSGVRVSLKSRRGRRSYGFEVAFFVDALPFPADFHAEFLAAALTKSRTEYCTPVAMTKSSGVSCCSISHCIST
jgi:hypothetical protein